MCGLIGFMGDGDPILIQALIRKARRRGPDAFGMAWMTPDGNRTVARERVPLALDWPERMAWGIGHARLTTSGVGLDAIQPLVVEDLVFAHNGTVYNHEKLAQQYGFQLATTNDSEVLAWLFLAHRCDPEETLQRLAMHQGDKPHAFIAALPAKMWVVASGQPVHVLEGQMARYACSWPFPGSRWLKREAIRWWA